MSENPTTTHSVITEIHSQNTVPAYKSNNPFKPSNSPRSGHTNSPRSPTASHFDSEKAKSTIREVMEEQDKGQIFQAKNILAADPNYRQEMIKTQDMNSAIKSRKKSVF